MRHDSLNGLLTSGLALLAAGGLLVALTYALTGTLPPAASALLLWVVLGGGTLRLAGAGALVWKRAAGQTAALTSPIPAEVMPEPSSLVAPPSTEESNLPETESEPESLTPLQYDLRLLGLGSQASRHDARRAYWNVRKHVTETCPPQAPEQLNDIYAAYRRLRKVLPSHPKEGETAQALK